MSEAFNERRLAAIILGDVVGYSRLMGFDEVGTMTALKAHRNELILPALAAYRARLVGAPGDSMLMEFASAVSAVSCAVAIQRGMLTRNAAIAPERQLRFRLGINLGDIVVDGDDIYGDGVNVAARLESLCEPGGLCLSRSIEEQIRGRLPHSFADDGEHELKNIAHPVRIFRLGADVIARLPEISLPTAPIPSARSVMSALATIRQPKLGPGALLNDTYEIDALIGSGGMGEIFKGHEIHSGGSVAIKVLRPDMIENKTAATLFQKEALVLKDINHDAIVRYYSFSFDPILRRHYLAMEFVDGLPLSELSKQAPLSMDAITALRRRVALGLDVAHRRGIVHRDMSSDNIIVPQREVSRAKIIDFGIARAPEIGGGTVIGDGFAGKYNYVSPEQLGLAGADVTPLSDIYSFGLVLAEACLGRPLDMGGSQAEVIEKRRGVPDLTLVDARLRPLIERMLQPEPARRPASMEEVATWSPELRSRGPEIHTRPVPVPVLPRTVPKPGAASRVPAERWIIGGAVALVLVMGASFAAYQALLAPQRHRPSVDDTALNTAPAPLPTPTPSSEQPPPPSPQPQSLPLPLPQAQPSPQALPSPQPLPSPQALPSPQPLPQTSPPPGSVIDRVKDFIKGYDGGDCFVAMPVRVTERSAAVDGFSQTKTAWEAFDTAFTSNFGFSPDVIGNRIWSHQCAAVQFLRRAAGDGVPPVLFLASTRVAQGQSLAGEIRGSDRQSLALLQVREDGTVVDVSNALKSNGNAQTFDLKMSRDIGSGPAPQMLIVVASQHPLTALNQSGARAADRIFASILDEASKRGDRLTVGAKLFLLQQ